MSNFNREPSQNGHKESPEVAHFRQRLEAIKRTERALLGGLLRWPAAILEALDVARPEDLYDAAHQEIARALLDMAERGSVVDLVTVAEYLRRKGQIGPDTLTSYDYLAHLWEDEPTGANAVHHAQMVRDQSLLRQMEQLCMETLRDCRDPHDSAENLLAETEQKLFALARLGARGETVPLPTVIDRAGARIEARADPARTHGLTTGLPALDALLAGLHPGELTIIGARPGAGKTAFSLGVMKHVVVDLKRSVFFASQEQPLEELGERLLCGEAKVSHWKSRMGQLDDGEWRRLTDARNHLRRYPNCHVDDRPGRVGKIVANARRLARRGGLDMILVDYAQLLEPDNPRLPMHEQIGAISRRLKLLAKEIPCSVVLLSQLNRDADDRTRPKMRDLKASGSLEQDADQVILLHRVPDQKSDTMLVEAIIEKNRHGPTGICELVYNGPFLTFASRDIHDPFPG